MWESPCGGDRDEIDHIIVSKSFCLTDVAVVPRFYTGSDLRLLRGRFSFTWREQKAEKLRERNPGTIINWDHFATLAGFCEDSAMGTRYMTGSLNTFTTARGRPKISNPQETPVSRNS
ncbi:hypothetical protein RB195_026566 [Necator americanus]|uniref:Uncharacterized protein n=1 Tax=Necator americanus TaxID=51031 RepID=A0ABR1EXR1_NECAM